MCGWEVYTGFNVCSSLRTFKKIYMKILSKRINIQLEGINQMVFSTEALILIKNIQNK